jgi:site-specific recombinase XerC
MSVSLAKQILPKSVIDGVYRSIDPFLRQRANGKGVCSAKTRAERRQFYLRIVAELWDQGLRIRKLESLSEKHVEALMERWHDAGICVATLHTRLSMISVLCDYLGKRGVTKPIDHYFPGENMQRSAVVKESKAWKAKNVDVQEMIALAGVVSENGI